jgi:transcriptional regulator with PAS, ATPase and Fis domain
MSLLLRHDYPGNVRELENIIEHGFVLCMEGEIDVCHLPEYLQRAAPTGEGSKSFAQNSIHRAEKDIIMDALKRNNYNRLAAARELGIHKSTLFRKLKKYKCVLPEIDGRSGRKE